MRKSEIIASVCEDLANLGLSYDEIVDVRRIAGTLSRWDERECNGEIERDETTGKCYRVSTFSCDRMGLIRDLETGAIRRLDAILAQHPSLSYFHQGDPRECALYIYPVDNVPVGIPVRSCTAASA
jgi:hypothetical protein